LANSNLAARHIDTPSESRREPGESPSTGRNGHNVIAVVVTYNPGSGEVERLTESLRTQVCHIVIVDNGSREHVANRLARLPDSFATCVALGRNIGVAAALNVGIAKARDLAASDVILFDQDSVPASDMIAKLIAAQARLRDAGFNLAAVGPCFLDTRADNPPPFIRVRGGRLVRLTVPDRDSEVEVDYLITSGSLISLVALESIGLLDERLFIDYIDVEWGLRAKRNGFRCFGVFTAHMRHNLGEAPLRLAGAALPVHIPLRHYYHFRNAIWLARQAWVPSQWKFVNTYRLVVKFAVYSLVRAPRLERISMMTRGIRDGFTGRLGHYRSADFSNVGNRSEE